MGLAPKYGGGAVFQYMRTYQPKSEKMSACTYRSLKLCSRHFLWASRALAVVRAPSLPTSSAPAATGCSFPRLLGSSPNLLGDGGDLEKAKEKLSTLTEDPGNDVKLKLYGLYKQVSCHGCLLEARKVMKPLPGVILGVRINPTTKTRHLLVVFLSCASRSQCVEVHQKLVH